MFELEMNLGAWQQMQKTDISSLFLAYGLIGEHVSWSI